MKKIFTTMLSCLMCFNLLVACGQGAYIDQEQTVPTEPVQSETESVTDEPAQTQTEEIQQTEEILDVEEAGMAWVVKSRALYQNGEELYKLVYSYNEVGQISEEIWYSGGEVSSRDIYNYDANNVLEERVTYYGDEARWRQTYSYTYDASGNLVEKVEYENGEEEFKFTYDASGNVVTEDRFHRGYTIQYTYNSEGELVKEVEYKDGEETGKTNYVYSYNADGDLIEKRTFQKMTYGEWTYKDSYTYDAFGNLVENLCYIYEEGDVTESRMVYEYIQIEVEPEMVAAIKEQQKDYIFY